jgi:hypothetical protein
MFTSSFFNKRNEFRVGEGSTVDIEVDLCKKIIIFFINKEQCPYIVENVSDHSLPLLFGISGDTLSSIIEVVSVQKSRVSSCSNINGFKKLQWENEWKF